MAQHEMRLRLLKNGKIDRKVRIFIDEHGYFQCHFEAEGSIKEISAWVDYTIQLIGADSFELGFKVGDEWWFEGDRFACILRGQSREVILRYRNYGWYWELLKVGTFESIRFGGYSLQDHKRIGNIHEETVNGAKRDT